MGEVGFVRVAQLAEVLAISTQSIRQSLLPCLPSDAIRGDRPKLVHGPTAVIAWVQKQSPKRVVGDADPLMAVTTDSPALERYRTARAEREEIEVKRLRGVLVAVDRVHDFHTRFAGIIRGAGERLQREYGDGPRRVLDEALGDALRVLVECLGDDSDGGANKDERPVDA